eukprot:Rmarinus@m.27536
MFAINMNPNDRFRVIAWRALCLTSTPNVSRVQGGHRDSGHVTSIDISVLKIWVKSYHAFFSVIQVMNREHEDANVCAGEPLLLGPVPVIDYCITEGAETRGGQLEACNANSSIFFLCATASWKYLFSVFKLKRHCKIDGEVAAP